MNSTREEHMAWCKKRALEYVDRGELHYAVASMASDLTKHPETTKSANAFLVQIALLDVMNDDVGAVRKWVNGFA